MTGPVLLELEHILDSHDLMIKLYGGAPGILNQGLLESVIGSVKMATQYAEMTVFEIAAKYGYKLVMNHCFEDGNKRVGAHVALTYLKTLGIELRFEQKDAIELFLGIATGQVSEATLAAWLENKVLR